MKSLIKIAFSVFAGMCILAACDDSDDNTVSGLSIDTEEITLGAEGGTEQVNIVAGTKWVAKVDQPWVQVMPANGIGSAECKIVVDTTLRNDIRKATVTFVPEGAATQKIEVHQTGYGKMIGLSIEEVEVPNMEALDKRYFDVSVTANVAFDIKLEELSNESYTVIDTKAFPTQSWITNEKYEQDLKYGARPRTTKVRFKWDMNTNPVERKMNINFLPLNSEDSEAKTAQLLVKQEASPKIEDNREGDSIALIIIREKIRSMTSWDTSEKLDYWSGIKLWEKKDPEVKTNPEMLGRVRSAEFRMLATKESLPDEVGKLTYVETLTFYGNENTMLIYDLDMGASICSLQYLKNLTVAAYGISKLPDGFENLKSLEKLDLGSNNFEEIPAVLNSTNFPNLKVLSFTNMQRYSSVTNLQTDTREHLGLVINLSDNSYFGKQKVESFKKLLKWSNLEVLQLTGNLIYGQLPDMSEIPCYTLSDVQASALGDTLKVAWGGDKGFEDSTGENGILAKTPKVLPNVKMFSISLNFLTGTIPDWIKNHPHYAEWDPFTFIYTQNDGYVDGVGKTVGFDSDAIPANFEEYYTWYPLRRPEKVE